MTVLAWLLLAVPLAFGLLRWRTTGEDVRYLVVAVASTLGSVVGFARRRMTHAPTVPRTLGAAGVAALCAAVTALLLGARSFPAIGTVALGFAVCSAGGLALLARSRAGRNR